MNKIVHGIVHGNTIELKEKSRHKRRTRGTGNPISCQKIPPLGRRT